MFPNLWLFLFHSCNIRVAQFWINHHKNWTVSERISAHCACVQFADSVTQQLFMWLDTTLDYPTHWEWRPPIFIPATVSSNWQHIYLHFHHKSVTLDVLCKQNVWKFGNHFHSKKVNFAPKIVIFNLCLCYQFEDSQIHWKKSHWAIATFICDKWGLICCSLYFYFLCYIIQNF